MLVILLAASSSLAAQQQHPHQQRTGGTSSAPPPPAGTCLPPAQRVNCPGPPGGKAGCLQRGCCYDNTKPGHTDWCSHYGPPCSAYHTNATCPQFCIWDRETGCKIPGDPPSPPPPPPPPPPSPTVWAAGRPASGGGEQVQVHASGAVTLSVGGRTWIGPGTPFACTDAQPGRVALAVTVGSASNGSDVQLGKYQQYHLRDISMLIEVWID
jgi:hypothetical protein